MTDGPDVPLLGAAEIRELAARLGIRPTKQWGQNFVVDANTVRRIVRVAGVGADDTVVEVGPGLGSLTLALLPVVEPGGRRRGRPGARRGPARHRRAARPGATPTGSSVVHGRRAAPCASCPGPPPTALVANLPYNVSVPVVLRFLELFPTPRARSWSWCSSRWPSGSPRRRARAPTACRASRPPGTPTCGSPGSVSRSVFWPVPNVDSGLVDADPPRAAGHDRHPRGGLPLRRRGVRPAPQDPAGGAGRLGRLAGARRGGAASPPASTRAPAVSSSTSRPSRRIAAARTTARAERA